MDKIIKVSKLANAYEFINKFSNKYETYVGTLGGKLSGGQKQRIALARCLYRDPKILILDEATSALDTISEKIVQASIEKIINKYNLTTIIIAHRLTTIKNVDKIIVMKNGENIEEGGHDQLMDLKGEYYGLVNVQSVITRR